jgi:hypothetical protein
VRHCDAAQPRKRSAALATDPPEYLNLSCLFIFSKYYGILTQSCLGNTLVCPAESFAATVLLPILVSRQISSNRTGDSPVSPIIPALTGNTRGWGYLRGNSSNIPSRMFAAWGTLFRSLRRASVQLSSRSFILTTTCTPLLQETPGDGYIYLCVDNLGVSARRHFLVHPPRAFVGPGSLLRMTNTSAVNPPLRTWLTAWQAIRVPPIRNCLWILPQPAKATRIAALRLDRA